MSQVNTIQFLNEYYRGSATFDEFLGFSLIYEIYHASIGQPWSKQFVFDNKDILDVNIINNYQDGVDDNQKFRSNDNKEITLPILLLSRYFSYFEPLLSGRWSREEVMNIDQPIETLEMIMSVVRNDRTNVDCSDLKDRLKYFGPKNEFYLLIPVQHDFDDDEAMVYLGKLLRNMFKNTLFEDSVYKCDDRSRDKMYFVSYQHLGFFEGGMFAAECLYRYGHHKLGLETYFENLNEIDGNLSPSWVDKFVDYHRPQIKKYKTSKVLIIDIPIYNGTLRSITTLLEAKFTGVLDEDDSAVLIIFGVLARHFCEEIKTLCDGLVFGNLHGYYQKREKKIIVSKLLMSSKWIINILYSVAEKICSNCHDKRRECEDVKELLDIVVKTKEMCKGHKN